MSNPHHTVFYIGVTSNLEQRVLQHKSGEGSAFTSQYNCSHLLYYEEYSDIRNAIAREKQLKKWKKNGRFGSRLVLIIFYACLYVQGGSRVRPGMTEEIE